MEIREALEAKRIPFKENSSDENEIRLCCPFCVDKGESQDHRFRLGVNIVTGEMHCFNCEFGSRDLAFTLRVLEEKLHTGALEAAAQGSKPNKPKTPIRLPEDFIVVKKTADDYWATKAYDYLHRRGVSTEQMKEKKIGYSLVGEYAFRIVIPVWYHGKLKGVVARDLSGRSQLKYKNSVGEKYLYNVPKAPRDKAVLSEGAFDALAIERGVKSRGFDSIAVLGHSLTDIQLAQLEDYKEIYLWPDPDEAGIKGFSIMARQLWAEKKKVFMVMPKMNGEDYDPSELDPSEIWSRVKRSKPFTAGLEMYLRNWLTSLQEA